jgi:hypothetical protein
MGERPSKHGTIRASTLLAKVDVFGGRSDLSEQVVHHLECLGVVRAPPRRDLALPFVRETRTLVWGQRHNRAKDQARVTRPIPERISIVAARAVRLDTEEDELGERASNKGPSGRESARNGRAFG